MVENTRESLLTFLSSHTDHDGLVSGVFDEIEQESVRVGRVWVGLDCRIPWLFAQCIRQHPELLCGLSLRLDTSKLDPVEGHRSPLRKAYWWGAKFRWDQLDSYGGPIRTVHADPSNLLQRLDRVARATFRWNRPRDEPIAILEIEEFQDTPETTAASPTTRYLHSIMDCEKRQFCHLDGAIKTYTPDGYVQAYAGAEEKAPKYEKLFRTDERMGVLEEPWLACVASFFAGDQLVREYFDGAFA
jgi:hypothetical protein